MPVRLEAHLVLCSYVLMFSALADYYKPMSVGGKVVFHCLGVMIFAANAVNKRT
jgi:hypothetical protein